jgi:hypothetical protein
MKAGWLLERMPSKHQSWLLFPLAFGVMNAAFAAEEGASAVAPFIAMAGIAAVQRVWPTRLGWAALVLVLSVFNLAIGQALIFSLGRLQLAQALIWIVWLGTLFVTVLAWPRGQRGNDVGISAG